jgi:hypothetical protein
VTPDVGSRLFVRAGRRTAPTVWLLLGHRAGDNAQLVALAERLGWPYEAKRLTYRFSELTTNLLFDATRLGRVASRSDPLGPPWPDLVISSGRRSEPIARWIRRHADPPPKLVHLGRPWRDANEFDLVIATPQYAVEPQSGVLHNLLPLNGVTRARLADAAARWRPQLAGLPRPRVAVLVGGDSELFTLDASAAARLGRDAAALVRESGGSLLVTTSARTPRRAVAALRDAIDVPAEIFEWSPDSPDNPYWGYLALADAFVVTGDSVSMLSEACATGKPVSIFDPGRGRGPLSDLRATFRRRTLNFGLPRLSRDIRRIHDQLVGRGHATFLGEHQAGALRPPPDPMEPTVARVRDLFGYEAAVPVEGAAAVPRVWAVTCGRAGDNSQILSLAKATGWPVEVKRLSYRRFGRLLDVWRGTTLLGVDSGRSSPLQPPWPDLVISASMRNEPVCRWIRQQSQGRTRCIHIGKPWARLATFDLVITVPEYRWLPQLPNVLHNACSLHDVNPAALAEQARIWAPAVADLPRPFVAVLVGGYAGPYSFDRENAERLGREASEMARKQGGSLLVTTSARTSRAAIESLVAAIDVPYSLFRWYSGADANPYLGFLALADSIIVTCDSTSMLAEACATRKPVYMFDLAADGGKRSAESDTGWLSRRWRRCNTDRLKAFFYRNVLLRVAPNKIKRDIGRVHEMLLSSGRAVWLGDRFPDRIPPPFDEMPRSLERVRALVAGTSAAGLRPEARKADAATRSNRAPARRARPSPTAPAR